MLIESPHSANELAGAAHLSEPDFARRLLENVRDTIPLTIEQIDMMLRVVAAARENVRSFLLIGCHDSLLASAILDEHPLARGFLIDDSDDGIAAARRHLRTHTDRLRFAQVDFTATAWTSCVAVAAPFDAVICGSARQLPGDESTREFYANIFRLLRPEGLFINIDHVASATRWTESAWDDRIIEAIFGSNIRNAPRDPRQEVARAFYAGLGESTETRAPLEVQSDWLREIGFENVECFMKVQELAMFGGQRPAGKPQ